MTALERAQLALTNLPAPGPTAGDGYVRDVAQTAALVSIAESLTVLARPPGAEEDAQVNAALACLPEIATLLQQLAAPHRDVALPDLERKLDPVLGDGAAMQAASAFAAAGWRLIGPTNDPAF